MSLLEDYKSIMIPAMGNLSSSYNICNIGYAVQLLRLEHPVPRWAAPAFASSCLCGAIVGQLLLGWAGDRFGRKLALLVTLSLVVIGAMGSAIFTSGFGDDIWRSLVIWRFILGIGVGGTYPLTAVYAGEMSDDRGLGRTSRVALSISCQVAGNILAPAISFFILLLLGTDKVTQEPWATELGWRLVLGLGALPCLVALRELVSEPDSHEFASARASGHKGRLNEVLRTLEDPSYRKRLIGCAAGWFCFDMSFFGIAVFLPHIVHDLIDKNDRGEGYLLLNSAVSALVNCIAIPATLLSFRLVADDGLGRKNLQGVSFLFISLAYAILALSFSPLRTISATTSVIALFSALFFCLNFGAGMTTYILPQESFPPEVRASMNGIAAAAGKMGAILGASAFAPTARHFGLGFTFGCCAVSAAGGLIATILFVDDMRKEEDGTKVLNVPEVQRHL